MAYASRTGARIAGGGMPAPRPSTVVAGGNVRGSPGGRVTASSIPQATVGTTAVSTVGTPIQPQQATSVQGSIADNISNLLSQYSRMTDAELDRLLNADLGRGVSQQANALAYSIIVLARQLGGSTTVSTATVSPGTAQRLATVGGQGMVVSTPIQPSIQPAPTQSSRAAVRQSGQSVRAVSQAAIPQPAQPAVVQQQYTRPAQQVAVPQPAQPIQQQPLAIPQTTVVQPEEASGAVLYGTGQAIQSVRGIRPGYTVGTIENGDISPNQRLYVKLDATPDIIDNIRNNPKYAVVQMDVDGNLILQDADGNQLPAVLTDYNGNLYFEVGDDLVIYDPVGNPLPNLLADLAQDYGFVTDRLDNTRMDDEMELAVVAQYDLAAQGGQ